MVLPPDHPQRIALNDEVHARPPVPLLAPLRISYLALFAEGDVREAGWQCARQLARRFETEPPASDANHFSADLGPFRLKCERHTEFLRFVFIIDGVPGQPFAEPAIGAVPADWLATLPGQLIVAAHVSLLRTELAHPDFDRISFESFGGNVLVGGAIAGGGAFAVTDFRIQADGFSRFLVLDHTMSSRQAGRMVQRLLEIDTYRILSLMALPVAHALTPILAGSENELAEIVHALSDAKDADEPLLFERLTRLEAAIEREQSHNLYRFEAANAYEALVHRRITELREERLPGLQTFQEFTERRLAPAIETCRSAASRQETLSQRLARVTQLLSTRVDITREGQNQRVLESMNRRAKLQLRLQETVEGLSVAAIAYYIIGLVGYAAKGAKAAGIPVDIDIVSAIAIPVVVVLTWMSIRRVRRAVTSEA